MTQALNVYVINGNRIFDNPAKKAKKAARKFPSGLWYFYVAICLFLFGNEVCNRRCDVNCGKCTDNNTECHCEDEAAEAVTTKDEDTQKHEQCGS